MSVGMNGSMQRGEGGGTAVVQAERIMNTLYSLGGCEGGQSVGMTVDTRLHTSGS